MTTLFDGAKFMRWNHIVAGRFAVGMRGGTVALYNTKTKKTIKFTTYQDAQVEDIQWDPNSQNYLLACWKDGTLSLLDADNGTEMQKFERQGAGITCISWIKNVPGAFVTCNDKISALKIWNVSNKSPQHTLKAGESPLLNIHSMFNTNYGKEGFLLTFKNGSVGIYNYNKRALDFLTQPNHSETIFDMAFKPNNKDMLATASFDGSVRIWETNQMKCIMNLQKANSNANQPEFMAKNLNTQIVYSIAWGPGESNLIVSVHSKGQVILWDYVKGKLLSEIAPGGEGQIFRVDWNTINTNTIAIAHSDGNCYVLTANNNSLSILNKLKHPRV
jgi:WD repeat-containing protein 17